MAPSVRSSRPVPWRLRQAGLCLAVALFGAWFGWLPFGFDAEERWGLPVLFALRGERPPPAGVMIVGVDGRSAARAGWPGRPELWPRSRHAELIRGLARACARLVVYDVFFAAPRDAGQDRQLAEALRAAGNVILVSHLGIADEVPPSIPSAAWQIEHQPAAAFAAAALAVAPFPLPGSAGGVSGYWLFKPDAGDVPGLPAVAIQAYAKGVSPASEPDATGIGDRLRRWRQRFREEGAGFGGSDLPETLQRLYGAPDYAYLNWFGPPRTVATVEFPAALARLAEAPGCTEPFAGKAVFVGMSELSPVEQKDRDTFDTPFTTEAGSRLSGVELAATAFANLLEGDAVQRIAPGWQLVLLSAWGGVVALPWAALAPPAAAGISLGAAVGYGWLVLWMFSAQALWLPWVIPALQLLAAAGGGVALQRQQLQRRLASLRGSLADWLPDDVVAEIVADPAIRRRVTGLVHGTCMAVRAHGEPLGSEFSDPVAVGESLIEILRTAEQIVGRHRGVAAERTRHGRLAVWVAAGPDSELRRSACLAGLALLEPGPDVKTGSLSPTPLSLRIGLHTGRIAVESLEAGGGAPRRSFGPIVDVAEHIEALNETLGTVVLASAETLLGIGGLQLRPLGKFAFPGLLHPLDIAEIRGPRGGCDDAEQGWLCDRFADALETYRRGDWEDCSGLLLEILARFPDDGPGHFFLRRCEYFRRHPQIAGWDPVVRL